jgi:hypothetical protein
VPKLQPSFSPPVHLREFAKLLEIAPRGGLRVVATMPPRWGKTELAMSAVPWALSQDPRLQFMYLSYGERLSFSKSKKTRRLCKTAGLRLSDESNAAHEWLTPEEGGMRAGGIQQSVIGHGANVIYVDDPHRNRAEAESAVLRAKAWDTYTSTVESRLEPDGSVIIFMQRWHEDDLAGRALATGEFIHVNIPALVDGQSTWPERWSVEALERRRRIVGEYDWASQYCGDPVARGGRVFFDAVLSDEIPPVGKVVIGVDLAHTARTSSDWSVAVAMRLIGYMDGDRDFPICVPIALRRRQARLTDVLRDGKVIETGFCRDIAELQARFPGAPTVSRIGGKEDVILELMAGLRTAPVEIEAIPAVTDKLVANSAYAAAWNDGRVQIPISGRWADEREGGEGLSSLLVHEHVAFTGKDGDSDDIVDACGVAWERLAEGGTQIPTLSGDQLQSASLGRKRYT